MRALISHWRQNVAAFSARHGSHRLALIAVPHAVAMAAMAATEFGNAAMAAFLLTWGIFNFVAIALTRRPLFAGLISLVPMTLLVLLSQLKYNVLMMTANFVDLMIVDTDTVSFLFMIFPALKIAVMLSVLALVPLVICAWRFDALRMRRHVAAFSAMGCVAGLIALETHFPLEPFEAFYGGNLVSSFARSGVDAIAELMTHGLMQSDAVAAERLQPFPDKCRPTAPPPHIILIHDESSFDIRMAPGIKVPRGYGAHFQSFDGKQRNFLVEGNGGPSWYTEYNVLAGLSARSFGRFAYFVTRIAAGRVNRGLPAALQRCGYRTFSLYPALGAFMSARDFQATTGVQRFYDQHDLGARDLEPDSFFFNAAARMIGEQRAHGPMFLFVYLAANHFPWDHRYRPDLMTEWQDLGNVPPVDEYLRRQAMSVKNYADFQARLKRDFPDDAFLIVRFGDHQPDFAASLIDPTLDNNVIAQRLIVRSALLHDLLRH
jgi:sulfatase-like protein